MPSAPKRFAETFEIWNRKLHYYLGLYFLFFLWLFAFTGLLLNHSWAFFEFWPNRKISTVERSIQAPSSGGTSTRPRNSCDNSESRAKSIGRPRVRIPGASTFAPPGRGACGTFRPI
jgi:hypothetical protein